MLIRILVWGLFLLIGSQLKAQVQKGELPKQDVLLTDKVLERTLNEYVTDTKAKVIAVIIERYDNDYTYTLEQFAFYNTIEKNIPSCWGEWKGRTLLFYTGIELISRFSDSLSNQRLLKFLRPKLPDQISIKKMGDEELIENAMTFDPVIWRFKVREGKLLWLRKNLAYQSEGIPYLK